MREILPSTLWIGNAQDARDIRRVLAAEIRVVIDLAIDEPVIQFPRDVVYCRLPLLDGEGNLPAILRSAIETTTTFVSARHRTLVACSGGMSRSPAIVSAVLARTRSISLSEAIKKVAATGPCDVSTGLWNDISEIVTRTTSPCLNLVVIRSLEPAQVVKFYSLFGMQFQEERHGSGPIHWAASLAEMVLEVYPAKSADEVDSTTRLGFEVNDAVVVLERLRTAGFQVVKELSQGPWGTRAVVRDSDGRSVDIVQATTAPGFCT